MRIGSERLLHKYGSPIAIAEALLEGRISSWEQDFVCDVVNKIILEAARIRLEIKARAAVCPHCASEPNKV